MGAGRRIGDATPRIRGLDETRTSGQDVFLWSGHRAVRHAFHNLNLSVGKRWDRLALLAPCRATRRVPSSPARTLRGKRVRLGVYPARKSAAAPLWTASATSGSSVLSCNLSPLATAAK